MTCKCCNDCHNKGIRKGPCNIISMNGLFTEVQGSSRHNHYCSEFWEGKGENQ